MHILLPLPNLHCAQVPLRVLLHNVVLSTSLLGLANIVLVLSLLLSNAVTSQAGDSTSNSSTDTVCDTGSVVIELSLSFLAFASGVLFLSLTFETLINVSK